MKKPARIVGIVIISILALATLTILTIFMFRDKIRDKKLENLKTERVGLLQRAGQYSADTIVFLFKYVQDSIHAREIREYFRLDTLLNRNGTTWDNAVTLATFVARNIPHANQKIQPKKRNAIALWEYHIKTEPAFNCRLHSIMLHELLFASGIINRFVTCMPVGYMDPDCHVVNIVWLPELQKWAMIDSDMQAFITDAQGMPLSLEEIREHYINEKPMSIHLLLEQADTGYYEAYWAKNLYWFQCWEQAEYNTEPANDSNNIVLLPQGFAGFGLNESTVRTSDAQRFWSAPAPKDVICK